jgi:hypothetical protein
MLEGKVAVITNEVVLRLVLPEDMGSFNFSHFLSLSKPSFFTTVGHSPGGI